MLSLFTYKTRDGLMRTRLDWGDGKRSYFTADRNLSPHLIALSMKIDKIMKEEDGKDEKQ